MEGALAALVCSLWNKKVPRIGQPIGADGPKVRQLEVAAVHLQDIASRLHGSCAAVCKVDAEAYAALDDRNLPWGDMYMPHLRLQHQVTYACGGGNNDR